MTLQPSSSMWADLPLNVTGVPGITIDPTNPPELILSDANLFNGSAST